MYKSFYALLFVVFFTNQNVVFGQNTFNKGQLWLEGQIGLSFNEDELARINQQVPLNEDIDDALSIRFQPKLHVALLDKLWVGPQLGIAYRYLESNDFNNRLNVYNYSFGGQVHYIPATVFNTFFITTEVGTNYNFLDAEQNNNSYLKAYFDIGIGFKVSNNWLISVKLKDVATYYSSDVNFDGRDDNGFNQIFDDFIDFPHFAIYYPLN